MEGRKYCDDRKRFTNYHSLSLISISGKIFERVVFNKMFGFNLKNSFILSIQSTSKAGDTCINEFLAINLGIHKSFANGRCLIGVFLEISEAFNKV